ncbi:MAG: phosphatase PAP2 family protein [Ferruginibacter sp.]
MDNVIPATTSVERVVEEKRSITMTGKIYAGFFSYIFHPVFVPVYVSLFLVYIHPSAFAGFSEAEKKQTILIILLNLVFFPMISVLLLRAVGFIESIYLRTQKDRIIPYIASGTFFFWGYLVFKQQPQYPLILTSFVLGIFLASSVALIANIYFKISMHAIGMGSWSGIFLIILKNNEMLMTWPLCIVLLLTGLVCSARILISSHHPKDIYMGLFVGLITQASAAIFVL